MSLNPTERAFLTKLAAERQGRIGMTREGHDLALDMFDGLIDDGLLIERQLGFHPGFQITAKGRAFLEGNPLDD